MPRRWRKLIGGLSYLLGFACTSSALAHGFGQRYDLPIPLSFYIWGAGATGGIVVRWLRLVSAPGAQFLLLHIECHPERRLVGAVVLSARALALGMLILVIVAGLFGSPDPIRNIAPVMIWIIGWVGMAFLSLLLGDVWALLNPWNTVFAFAESSYRRMHAGGVLGLRRGYPDWLGAWPAFVLFVLFAWMELVWSGKNVPAELAAALLVYSGLTWLGMFVFGRETWLGHGEVFTLVFGTFARFAPLARMPEGQRRHLRAAAGGWLARGSSFDDLDGRAGDCAAGDRHIRRFARNAVMGAVDFAVLDWASDSSIWTAVQPARRSGRAAGSHLGLARVRSPVSGSICGRVLAHR